VGEETHIGLDALTAWRWANMAETKQLAYVVRNSDGDVVAAGCGHAAEGGEDETAAELYAIERKREYWRRSQTPSPPPDFPMS
jgi:hypothetical protein